MSIITYHNFENLVAPFLIVDNNNSVVVTEKTVECEFSFAIFRDHVYNETSVVGHLGKDSFMSFINPGKFVSTGKFYD